MLQPRDARRTYEIGGAAKRQHHRKAKSEKQSGRQQLTDEIELKKEDHSENNQHPPTHPCFLNDWVGERFDQSQRVLHQPAPALATLKARVRPKEWHGAR